MNQIIKENSYSDEDIKQFESEYEKIVHEKKVYERISNRIINKLIKKLDHALYISKRKREKTSRGE